MIVGGEKSNLPSYNATVFPAFGFGEWTQKKYALELPARFSAMDNSHPLLSNLFADQLGATPSINTTQNLLPESPDITQAFVMAEKGIIALNDGAILTERTVGKGRVVVLGLPATPTWSTFPITGIFATLMYRMPGHISMSQENIINTPADQEVSLRLSSRFSGVQSLLLQEPNGASSLRKPIPLPSGVIVRFDGFTQTGVYGVLTPQNQAVAAIAVNHSAQESVGDRWTSSELRTRFTHYLTQPETLHLITPDDRFDITVERQRSGTELWQVCVFLAFCCGLIEVLYARSIAQQVTMVP